MHVTTGQPEFDGVVAKWRIVTGIAPGITTVEAYRFARSLLKCLHECMQSWMVRIDRNCRVPYWHGEDVHVGVNRPQKSFHVLDAMEYRIVGGKTKVDMQLGICWHCIMRDIRRFDVGDVRCRAPHFLIGDWIFFQDGMGEATCF